MVRTSAAIIVLAQAEARIGQIAQKNTDARIEKLFEVREIHVELKRAPEAAARFLRVARAHQQIQRIGMIREQIRRDVGADVAGGPGQENGHSVWVRTSSRKICPQRPRRLPRYAPQEARCVWGELPDDGPRSEDSTTFAAQECAR